MSDLMSKRVVVTGAAGFIGEPLVHALAEDGGWAITATDTKENPSGLPGGVRYISGDIADAKLQAEIMGGGCDAVVHLATIPSGGAEKDPQAAKRVNLEATLALSELAAKNQKPPRFIFASSIAVYSTHNVDKVDDATRPAPNLLYGAHKAMAEVWLSALTRRGEIDAISLRLPGIVARPRAPSGMTSAFFSDIFHALAAGEKFTAPVSRSATTWLLSRTTTIRNVRHALNVDGGAVGDDRAFGLPAIRCTMDDLAKAILAHTGGDADQIAYEPQPAIEKIFGSYPPLATDRARALGFTDDGDLEALVRNVFEDMERVKGPAAEWPQN